MPSSLTMLLPSPSGFSPSSTCVGLRYGYHMNNSGFSWQSAHALPYLKFSPHHVFGLHTGFAWCTPTPLAAGLSVPGSRSLPASPQFCHMSRGTGISTCCPSATSFDLALGPDLPRADQLFPGNLRYFSAGRIPTFLSLLIPAFSPPSIHSSFPVLLRLVCNAPLPIYVRKFLSFGSVFQPRTFSAQDLSTSELLRTL